MRDFIVRFLEWVDTLIGREPRKHSAAHFSEDPAPAPAAPRQPKTQPLPLPEHVLERLRPLDGEATRLIRPYYANHIEQGAREKAQRQRRRELFWASMGLDYPGVRLVGTDSA
jgi:hypothetical protein